MAKHITDTVLTNFLLVVLAGHKDGVSPEELGRMESEGIIYHTESHNHILPYPLLRALLPQVNKNIIREHLLPLPGTPFYWQHFEDLEVQLEVSILFMWGWFLLTI